MLQQGTAVWHPESPPPSQLGPAFDATQPSLVKVPTEPANTFE